MSETAGYKTSTLTVLLIGGACLVVGLVLYLLLFNTTIGALGFFVGLFGLVLLILGTVRVVRRKPR